MKHPVKSNIRGINMRRFVPSEFRGWHMSLELLVKLDLLAIRWRNYAGRGITVSEAKNAIGRNGRGTSQHYWEEYGEVRAIDVFPGITTLKDAVVFAELAVECGFTGIGVYPEANPTVMFHLDVRVDRDPEDPADWGAKRSQEAGVTWDYISFNDAMEMLE